MCTVKEIMEAVQERYSYGNGQDTGYGSDDAASQLERAMKPSQERPHPGFWGHIEYRQRKRPAIRNRHD